MTLHELAVELFGPEYREGKAYKAFENCLPSRTHGARMRSERKRIATLNASINETLAWVEAASLIRALYQCDDHTYSTKEQTVQFTIPFKAETLDQIAGIMIVRSFLSVQGKTKYTSPMQDFLFIKKVYAYEKAPQVKTTAVELKKIIKKALDAIFEHDPSLEFTMLALGK